MPDDRPYRNARPVERQPFSGPPQFNGPRPFRPGPRPDTGAPVVHTVRIRDGEREIEVSGSAPFVRQVLDDLSSVWSQLRGEAAPPRASIRMPEPAPQPAGERADDEAPAPVKRRPGRPRKGT